MLFWILLAIAIVGIVWAVYDEWNIVADFIAIIGVLAVLVSIGIFASNNIGVDGYVSRLNTRYEIG